MKNGLYIIATPIGNLGDISPRAIERLKSAEIIACEDKKKKKKLLSLLSVSINKEFMTLHDHNEEVHTEKIISKIKEEGKSVALISDAGSPLISDPGYKLIRTCREQNIYITTIPGCCALICALQLSGLPTNRFMFAGFLPNKDKARTDSFLSVREINATIIFYETANRIQKTLEAAKEIFANREMAVAREITKVYEECINGTAEELLAHFSQHPPKGEMVLMIAPPNTSEKEKSIDIKAELARLMKEKSLKSAVKEIVETYNLNKNEVYEQALELKNEK